MARSKGLGAAGEGRLLLGNAAVLTGNRRVSRSSSVPVLRWLVAGSPAKPASAQGGISLL